MKAEESAKLPMVAICIPTFRRPELLRRLLESLDSQDLTLAGRVAIVVVDNDIEQTARKVVEDWAEAGSIPARYYVEPRRNIALARNKAIESGLDLGADLLAFIDDDEVADPTWLHELLRVRAFSSAEIVAGPVTPTYQADIPQWIINGRFFEIPRHPTGSRVSMAYTGNVLLSREAVEAPQDRFDQAFGRHGGEDSHFFMRAVAAGRAVVWANEAIVREPVNRSRARASWILKRAFRVGNQYVACERSLLPVGRWLPARIVKAGGRVLQGLVLLIPAFILGRSSAVTALRWIAHGAGCFTSLLGFSYGEYDSA